MSDSDDELLKRLDALDMPQGAWPVTPDGVPIARQAAARIRELEAELDALKSDLSGYMGAANTYVNELHGVHSGTHVIVPVEPTEAMKRAALDYTDMPLKCWSAYISAAQPNASD